MVRSSISRHLFLISLLSVAASACADEPAALEDAGPSEWRGLEDGLELHWSFEDRVGNQITDLSGNARHGTLSGGAFVSSPLGEAVSLDGVDDSIALAHLGLRAPSLYGGVSGDFTISARVRVANVDKFNTLCFGCGPLSAMYVGAANYPAKLLTALFNQSSNGTLWPLSTSALTNDEWREVTLVVDGGGSARYYLDCALDGELVNANIGLKDYNFSAVGQGSSADRWYGGEIDQLRVWSRALSEPELAELCPQTPALEQGLTLHWSFEDHVGSQITDLSGNGRHGTLNGGSFVASPHGEAVNLDGVDDSIGFTGPRSPALYGGVDGDFTISARVKVADIDKYNTLSYGAGPSASWILGDSVHGGRMTAGFSNQSNNGVLWTASTPAMVEAAWTEVTMVVDGGTSVRHYFDCALDSETPNANVGLKDYNFSSIGQSGNPARWFGGQIDALRVWDRALSEQDLQGLCADSCGQWHSIKTGAAGLDKVWTDGVDILAVGKRDFVKRGAGSWTDTEVTTADRLLHETFDIWGPALDDHWLLGHATSYGNGIFHFNGTELGEFLEFPEPAFDFGTLVPTDLAGSGPNDVWAMAMADCDTMACGDPECDCNYAPSVLMHYDGVAWQEIAAPALLTRMWTDGTSTWAVGGRDTSVYPWLSPTPGTVVRYANGWELWADDMPPLFAVWAMNDDDVWVAGEAGTLRHLDFGIWVDHDLPTTANVIKLGGRASNEVWALDSNAQLWAYDGGVWTEWLLIPGARDFDVLDDGLVVVGDDEGHVVYFVDVVNATFEPIYARSDEFVPSTIVAAADMSSAVASRPLHGSDPSGSWRWQGSTWTPTYVGWPGFDQLVGPVDQGFATRAFLTNDDVETFHPVYDLVDGQVLELVPPAPNLSVTVAERIVLDNQEQLWIGGRTTDTNTAFLYALEGGNWVDRQPPGVTGQALRITQGNHRVFVGFSGPGNPIMRFALGVWADISNPLNGQTVYDLVATGPSELWATQYTGQNGPPEHLYFWNGVSWAYAPDLWPEIAGYAEWRNLDAVGSELWMVSERSFAKENVAHWDGTGWTVLDTPDLLHGWREGTLIEGATNGAFVHDGVRLWTYEECVP